MKKISNFIVKYADALACWTAGAASVSNAASNNLPMAIVWGIISTMWFIICIGYREI